MRFIVLPLCLAACAPESGPLALPSDDPDDMSAFLVDAPKDAFAERTWVADTARGAILPGGELLYGEPWESAKHNQHVVVDANDEMGVMVDTRSWQLVVWLDRADLQTVPVVHTWVSGVRIPAGVPLEIHENTGDQTRITVENEAIAVDAWAPSTALDQFWYSDDAPEPWERGEGLRTVRVLSAVEVLDGPLGEPFARTQESTPESLSATVVEEARGHLHVRLVADGWPVDGWVHADDVEDPPLIGWGTGGCSCGGSGHLWSGPPNVRADAPFRASEAGPIIGRTKLAQRLSLGGQPGEWRTTELETAFGTATVWIDPDDLI
ncbi:MAG: hypothetical protein R3F61_13130 [Myxococcota bacterium]